MEDELSRKDRIDKTPTSAAEPGRGDEYDIAGNVRRKGQDPSPDDRARGARTDSDAAGAEPAGRR